MVSRPPEVYLHSPPSSLLSVVLEVSTVQPKEQQSFELEMDLQPMSLLLQSSQQVCVQSY
jgi:hypothetical protein